MTVKEFYEYIGGNYNSALATMMNDAFIMRMLSKFVSKNAYEDIISSFEADNYRGVFEASHALKGVCGNLSLTPLFDISSKICEATRTLKEGEKANIEKEINELKEIYKKVADAINELLNL